MPNRPPLPMTRAILLADNVLTEAGSHKKSLIGIYSRVGAASLPLQRVIHVYAQFSDALGEYFFDIELAHLNSENIIHRGQIGPVMSRDRLLPLELVMHLPCRFEEYGEYELRISHEGNIFASRVFGVLPPPEPASPFSDDVDSDQAF